MRLFEIINIALRGLMGNKMRSLLTMLGVIIGVSSVITLIAIGEGVRDSVSKQIEGLGSNIIIVTPGKGMLGINASSLGGAVSALTFDDALAVERGSGAVKNVAPVIESSANVESGKKINTLITGTTESYYEVRNAPLAEGNFFSRGDIRGYRPVVVLGYSVKRAIFPKENPIGKTLVINESEFKIIGVMKKKGPTLTIDNDDRVFIPITVAEEIFETQQVNMMFVQSRSPQEVSIAVDETKKIIRDRHDKNDFIVSEQEDILDTFQGIMGTLTGMLGAVAGVSLVVGGIGIMNIMLVTVTERTREIGIRKAVGAKKRDIMVQFLLESILISTIGGMIGIAIGFAGTELLQRLIPRLPTIVSPWSVIVAFLFSLVVGLFFGIYPARKAAGLNPIEALRYE